MSFFSPDRAFLLRVHFAANGAFEVFGKLLAVGQGAQDPEPSRGVTSGQNLRFQARILVLEAPDLQQC